MLLNILLMFPKVISNKTKWQKKPKNGHVAFQNPCYILHLQIWDKIVQVWTVWTCISNYWKKQTVRCFDLVLTYVGSLFGFRCEASAHVWEGGAIPRFSPIIAVWCSAAGSSDSGEHRTARGSLNALQRSENDPNIWINDEVQDEVQPTVASFCFVSTFIG